MFFCYPTYNTLGTGVQASMGLAALHNFDIEGIPSVVHNDISPNQFVKVGNMFRLNDFNRARLLTKNVQTQQLCPYREGTNRGKNRSPEGMFFARLLLQSQPMIVNGTCRCSLFIEGMCINHFPTFEFHTFRSPHYCSNLTTTQSTPINLRQPW
jgi:hypothetical protein